MNGSAAKPAAGARVTSSLHELFVTFLKIGLLSFGGPAGQIALMHRIVVEEKRWLSDARFLHALNYCMLLPGPEAQQLATYIGWLLHGTRGGIVAGLLFILPGFFVITALSLAYALFQSADWFETLFFGLKAAVLAIVVQAVIALGRKALKSALAVGLAACAFVALFAFAVPFPLVVLAAALIGLARSGVNGATIRPADGDEIDRSDARGGWKHALRTLLIGCLIWAAPVVPLVIVFGPASVFADIAAFFSFLAVVTFGGAYAVLAFVAQEAVNGYQWLTSPEMLDGLAMAETTPGPLIIILTFVGFIASFRAETGLDPVAAGLIGAALTTWVTFVPCFMWIFLGAPYVERLRGNRRLAGALSAITAAVVGVVLNLAIWFALHVLFGEVGRIEAGPLSMPWPDAASIDWLAAAFVAGALVMTFVFRLGVLSVLGVAAAAGLVIGMLV